VALQALGIAGQDASNVGRLLMQMGTESGGNPAAINRWDSNWTAGHPSVGLMQVIGGTYAKWHHPAYNAPPFEYGVSEDPLSNILASIRYTVANYGSLAAGWQGHGYDGGGWLPPGMTMAYNGTGVPERVLTAPQYQALSTAASQGGPKIDVHVYPRAEHSEAAIADMVEHRLGFALRAVT
jgi:SLT domain-containing protein